MLENNGFMEQKDMDDIEKDINLQEIYNEILDKLIDAFVALRYERNRDYLTFFLIIKFIVRSYLLFLK